MSVELGDIPPNLDEAANLQNRLEALRAKYNGALETPEFHTPAFQVVFWQDLYEAGGERVKIPPLPWTEAELRKPMIDVRDNPLVAMPVYNADIFGGKRGLVRLGARLPHLRSWSVQEGTTVQDTHNTPGWVRVEASLNSPNLNTNRGQIETHVKRHGYLGQRLGTYILLGDALHVLTGEYPDLRTWSRLPGSRYEGRMVFTSRGSVGYLYVGWHLSPQNRYPDLGARFEEVKLAPRPYTRG